MCSLAEDKSQSFSRSMVWFPQKIPTFGIVKMLRTEASYAEVAASSHVAILEGMCQSYSNATPHEC